jgi:hypothetical protein
MIRDTLGFLRGLQAHPLVDSAALIGDYHNLPDFDPAVLRHVLCRPVLRRADPP